VLVLDKRQWKRSKGGRKDTLILQSEVKETFRAMLRQVTFVGKNVPVVGRCIADSWTESISKKKILIG